MVKERLVSSTVYFQFQRSMSVILLHVLTAVHVQNTSMVTRAIVWLAMMEHSARSVKITYEFYIEETPGHFFFSK